MPHYSVMLARFPGNNQEHPDSAGWVTETALKIKDDPRVERLEPWRISDTPAPMIRNRAVRQAALWEVDYLLMIDNDMEPDPKRPDGKLLYVGAAPFWETAFEFLLAHRELPCAVGAPYCGPSPHNNIFVFLWRNKNNKPDSFSLEQFSREEAALRGGIEEVAALPTGLILYDMRIFKNMKKPYFYYEYSDEWESEKGSTEDVTQTRDMSLGWYMSGGQQGGKVFCAWDCWARHIKLEHIDKPHIIPVDMVGESLKQAARRNLHQNERLSFVGSGVHGDRTVARFQVDNGEPSSGQPALSDTGAI